MSYQLYTHLYNHLYYYLYNMNAVTAHSPSYLHRHPHIVSLFGAGLSPHPFLLLELLPRQTMRDLIKNRPDAVTTEVAMRMMKEVRIDFFLGNIAQTHIFRSPLSPLSPSIFLLCVSYSVLSIICTRFIFSIATCDLAMFY